LKTQEKTMVVRPKKNFRHVSWSTTETLDKTKVYPATPAIGKYGGEAKGLIWVGNFLLGEGEYDVVTEESEPTPTMQFCWWA
jgi:hypothetical protein